MYQLKKIKYLFFSLLVLLSFAVPPFSSSGMIGSPSTISSVGAIHYQTIPNSTIIKRQMYYNSEFSPELHATKSDMWIGHYDALAQVPQIHALNPDHICLLYRNGRLIWASGPEYIPSEYQLFVNNNWLLKDSKGQYCTIGTTAILIDVGNPDLQQWIANWFKNYIDSYGADGAYLDSFVPNLEFAYGASANPINPRTGKLWTAQEFKQACMDMVDKISDTTGKPVLSNSCYSGEHFYRSSYQNTFIDYLMNSKITGFLCEGWISTWNDPEWYSEEKWKKGIDMAVWIEDNFLSRGNKVFWTKSDNAAVIWYPEGQAVLPSGVTKEQYVTYCYASRLLAAKNDGNYMNLGLYMPENYPQSLFEVNIGSPLGNYYKNGNLYIRQFTDGMVIVNPTYSSQQFSVNEAYKNAVDGVSVSSSLTVLPHTGIILKRM
jgi:hypothetical protein